MEVTGRTVCSGRTIGRRWVGFPEMRDITEHALLIVKPDGVRHSEFPRILERRLADLSLRQVATRDLIMSRDQARTFWRKGDVEEYIAYLREGPSWVIVVRGRQATWKCRRLKFELRKEMNCSSYRNLVHSTEPGNEYEEQFRRLFPELKIDQHGIFIDQIAVVAPDRFDSFLVTTQPMKQVVPRAGHGWERWSTVAGGRGASSGSGLQAHACRYSRSLRCWP